MFLKKIRNRASQLKRFDSIIYFFSFALGIEQFIEHIEIKYKKNSNTVQFRKKKKHGNGKNTIQQKNTSNKNQIAKLSVSSILN